MRACATAVLLFLLKTAAPGVVCAAEQKEQPPAVTLEKQGAEHIASSPAYRARIGPDGNLHSLVVGSTELLDDTVSISRGVYLYSGEVVSLADISSPAADTLVARGEQFSIAYTFLPSEVRMVLRHTSPKPVSLFAVLSAGITLVTSMETQESASAPADQPWGTAKFAASSGAFITLRGGTRIWGPWMGRQVWEAALIPPSRDVQIAAVLGQGPLPAPPTGQLVTMTASCDMPGHMFSAGETPTVNVAIENRSDHTLSGEVSAKLPGQPPYGTEQVSLAPKSKSSLRFPVPVTQPDVYRVVFSLAVEGAEVVTTDVSIAYQADRIKPSPSPPDGFSSFWSSVVRGVRSIPLEMEFTPDDARSDPWIVVGKLRYRGGEGEYISGWYCAPAEKGRYRAMLQLPGYGARHIAVPSALARRGWAVLSIDFTGRDLESRDAPPPYLTDGILSPATYSLRKIAAHSLKAIDALASQPQVDSSRIAVSGPGLGAALAITLGALDERVRAVAADVPLFCNVNEALASGQWPYSEIRDYVRMHPAHDKAVMRTLSFFDAVNFAPTVKCPVMISLGLRDTTSPPRPVFALFNNLPEHKQIEVYPQAGHEAGGSAHWKAKLDWLDGVLPP